MKKLQYSAPAIKVRQIMAESPLNAASLTEATNSDTGSKINIISTESEEEGRAKGSLFSGSMNWDDEE